MDNYEQTLAMSAGIACMHEHWRPIMNVSSRASKPVFRVRRSQSGIEIGSVYAPHFQVRRRWRVTDGASHGGLNSPPLAADRMTTDALYRPESHRASSWRRRSYLLHPKRSKSSRNSKVDSQGGRGAQNARMSTWWPVSGPPGLLSRSACAGRVQSPWFLVSVSVMLFLLLSRYAGLMSARL
jgi:hypothetical protein